MVVDVQEKLFPLVDHPNEVLEALLKLLKGSQTLEIPIVVTEQYPTGLGGTIPQIKEHLPKEQKYWAKTTFSGMRDQAIDEYVSGLPVEQWILVGIEAHVCIMQTAKDLAMKGKQVVVINDAISSRSIYDFSTAIAEIKEWARITSAEAALFELIGDASSPEFKASLDLIKARPRGCCQR